MSPALVTAAFAMGLAGSVHCVAMCGGIVSVLSGGLVALGAKKARATQASGSLIAGYNAGRIASYSIAGAIVGAIGSTLDRLPIFRHAEVALRIFAGVVMLGLGLYLAGIWSRFAIVEKLGAPVWRRIEPLARRLLPVRNLRSAFALGLLWGWMPCGLVYAALALALGSGTTTGGALVMFAFGAGTLPMLLAMGALGTKLADATRIAIVRRVAGVTVMLFGIFTVVQGRAQWDAQNLHACCAAAAARAAAASTHVATRG